MRGQTSSPKKLYQTEKRAAVDMEATGVLTTNDGDALSRRLRALQTLDQEGTIRRLTGETVLVSRSCL